MSKRCYCTVCGKRCYPSGDWTTCNICQAADARRCDLPCVAGVEFRWIPSMPGYCAGSDGSIWSSWASRRPFGKWRRRTQSRSHDSSGRLQIGTSSGTFRVHRLIAEAFHGPCPDGMECRHLDGNAANNVPGNLAWGTHVENEADKVRHGTRYGVTGVRGEKHHNASITEDTVREIYRLRGTDTATKIASRFGVSRDVVGKIHLGKTWRCVTGGIE